MKEKNHPLMRLQQSWEPIKIRRKNQTVLITKMIFSDFFIHLNVFYSLNLILNFYKSF